MTTPNSIFRGKRTASWQIILPILLWVLVINGCNQPKEKAYTPKKYTIEQFYKKLS